MPTFDIGLYSKTQVQVYIWAHANFKFSISIIDLSYLYVVKTYLDLAYFPCNL